MPFSIRNVLKSNVHNCRGCAMLVHSCFSTGKIRECRFHFRGGPVEVVQLFFGDSNVLNFSFDKCRGCVMLIKSCFSAGKIR